MKTLRHTLSAIALFTITAVAAAFAGPSNPASSFIGVPGDSVNRHAEGCPMMRAETKLTVNSNTKAAGLVERVSGFKHEGCTMNKAGEVVCKPNAASCASMRQG